MRRALLLLLLVGCRRHATEESQPTPVPPHPTGPKAETCPSGAVMTGGGCVRGERTGQLVAFRGIPYAAPPIGPLRWKPPQPAPTWPGVREATAFGASCPQLDDTIGGKLAWNEDCLTLNVWTPKVDAKAKLPVMVWIHGGGLVQGGSAVPVYDGANLAAAGVVVVSINYRLGPLGYLAHPALTAEDPHHASGNLGLLDQIAALGWVKREVGAFGGDPSAVTIFGESAGGESVCALMASPLAAGLFARAIIESAQCVGYGKALRDLHTARAPVDESGEDQGLRVAKALGCTSPKADDVLACLRGKPVTDVLHASPAALGFLGKGEHYGLIVDGHALLDAPAALLEAGKLAAVPAIVGTTADEATLFTAKLRMKRAIGYEFVVGKVFGPNKAKVLARYPASAYPSPKQAFDALVTDLVFACPTRRAARKLKPAYRYVFSHVTAHARDKGIGATHGSELPFVFGTQASPTADERVLATAMLGYWTRFAKTGDPNGGGAPAWPAYDAATDTYLELGVPIAAKAGLHTAACDDLDTIVPALHEADED